MTGGERMSGVELGLAEPREVAAQVGDGRGDGERRLELVAATERDGARLERWLRHGRLGRSRRFHSRNQLVKKSNGEAGFDGGRGVG
uniref:DUF834 domain-containing protein n=1 Tax=Oryza sativa subsp. japonica TaxID=39947 RepID=Q851B4_ORYSJ|nr:hypothetical protein [Oryza sativa Japonica Group]